MERIPAKFNNWQFIINILLDHNIFNHAWLKIYWFKNLRKAKEKFHFNYIPENKFFFLYYILASLLKNNLLDCMFSVNHIGIMSLLQITYYSLKSSVHLSVEKYVVIILRNFDFSRHFYKTQIYFNVSKYLSIYLPTSMVYNITPSPHISAARPEYWELVRSISGLT